MLIGFTDTETTSNDPLTDKICEIALIVTDEFGNEKARIERRLNPKKKIVAKAVAIHGITDADVLNCPDFEEYGPKIKPILEKLDLVIAHNGDGFDFPLFQAEFKRIDSPIVFKKTFDTMLQGRFATADGKVPTLGELCWSLDVSYDTERAHSALYDIEVLRDCFFQAVKLGYWDIASM